MRKQHGLTRRQFLHTTLIAGVGVGLAACQPVPATQVATEDAAAPEAVTVRMWHHWGGDRVPLMDTQIADFMAAYPHITVEATLQPWGQRLEKLLASITAGTPPDITMLAQHDMAPFVRAEALLPLAERMADADISLDQYYGPEAEAMQREGNV